MRAMHLAQIFDFFCCYEHCITPRKASMLGSYCIDERPIYAGNASLVKSIMARHLRNGLRLA